MIIYAHRGSSQSHPENTLEAFESAIEEGADGIETDLRLTRDGVIVLAHDEKIAGLPVAHATFAELSDTSLAAGRQLATLEELIDLASGRVSLNLEIKDPVVVPLLKKHEAAVRDALFTSFSLAAFLLVRDLFPDFSAGLVFDRWGVEECEYVEAMRPAAVSLRGDKWSPAALEACHNAGSRLLLWVVNDPARAVEAARLGLDGIFTDNPAKIVKAVRGWGNR